MKTWITLLCLTFTFNTFADAKKIYHSAGHKFRFETLFQGSDVIWGFDFLKDGRIIFTERSGKLRIFDPHSKTATEIQGVPKVWAQGQGGLLDVRVHPGDSSKIFFTYSEPLANGATTALATATVAENKLTGVKKIFSGVQGNNNEIHFGSRLEFSGANYIFMTMGDRDEREHAQNLAFHQGKIIRLNMDGSVPTDNPFVQRQGAKPEIWSLGHRSPQGLVRHPVTGDLWMSEMGPRGGDEINLIKPGNNYGWPEITYGREYWGPKIGTQEKEGLQQPVVYWVPSISPSGIAFYNGKKFSNWRGNLFIGTLSGMHLRRLVLNGQKVVTQEELLKDLNIRVRNVRPGSDDLLYLSTDNGKLARLVPAL